MSYPSKGSICPHGQSLVSTTSPSMDGLLNYPPKQWLQSLNSINPLRRMRINCHRNEDTRNTRVLQYEQRLISFKYWPLHQSVFQTKEKMAEAGFYYYGLGDHVMCFYCGCSLSNWEPFDDPWEQHALWAPGCVFVIVYKGQHFINRVHSHVKKYAYSPGNFSILRPSSGNRKRISRKKDESWTNEETETLCAVDRTMEFMIVNYSSPPPPSQPITNRKLLMNKKKMAMMIHIYNWISRYNFITPITGNSYSQPFMPI